MVKTVSYYNEFGEVMRSETYENHKLKDVREFQLVSKNVNRSINYVILNGDTISKETCFFSIEKDTIIDSVFDFRSNKFIGRSTISQIHDTSYVPVYNVLDSNNWERLDQVYLKTKLIREYLITSDHRNITCFFDYDNADKLMTIKNSIDYPDTSFVETILVKQVCD